MITPTPVSLMTAAVLAAGGASAGRGLAVLAGRWARAEGLPSCRYYALADGARGAGLPLIGHFLRSRGSRCPRLLAMEGGGALAVFFSCLLFPPAEAAAASLFLLALLGASVIDLDHMVIPDLFTVGLAGAGLILSAAVPALHGFAGLGAWGCLRSLAAGALGLAIGSAFLLWFALAGELLLGREVLGFGDVKFVGAIGAFCGWQGAVFGIFGGAAIGAAALLLVQASCIAGGPGAMRMFDASGSPGSRGRLAWGAPFPFGPMLAAAAALYLLALHAPVDAYLARYAALF